MNQWLLKILNQWGLAFTVSVDASNDIESGISAKDRAIVENFQTQNLKTDFVKPGHIFPLRYQKGGVLVRAGHTEGSVDLVKLSSGKRPAAVICEVMNEDGTMARGDDLRVISEKYNMPIVSIEDIIAYRIAKENLVEKIAEAKLPTKYGDFKIVGFKSKVDKSEPIALIKGEIIAIINQLWLEYTQNVLQAIYLIQLDVIVRSVR